MKLYVIISFNCVSGNITGRCWSLLVHSNNTKFSTYDHNCSGHSPCTAGGWWYGMGPNYNPNGLRMGPAMNTFGYPCSNVSTFAIESKLSIADA